MKKSRPFYLVPAGMLMLAMLLFTTGFAYLDPGTGSLLVQILIAVVLAAAATFRRFKSRILNLFKKNKGEGG